MKVTKLTVQNIGIVEDACIPINKPEIVFYGEIKQGKSTLLNAVRWVCGGAFPADIIRHGQREAFVQLEGTESDRTPWVIRREWYVAKDQTSKAREIVYTHNGVPVKKPVDQIKAHLNPFLLDQEYLRKMTTLERGRYLTELFGVATDGEDALIRESEQQASQLRIKIKMYGAVDLTPVVRVDVHDLQREREEIIEANEELRVAAKKELEKILADYESQRIMVDARNREIREKNSNRNLVMERIGLHNTTIAEYRKQIADLQLKLANREDSLRRDKTWLEDHSEIEEESYPTAPYTSNLDAQRNAMPNTAEIDARIQEAGAVNVRADNYEANKVRATEKAKDEKALLLQEKLMRDLKAAKVAKLAAIGKTTGIPGLTFKEGGFEFDGADSSMLSDSQIMRLSEALSAKYPEGFGLSLLDRGESLGKTVLTLWEEAQAREATVLVTVVGDKPAIIPEQVGAFVIEGGKVK